MPLRWNDIPLESKVYSVNDAVGWQINAQVPQNEEWLILSWQIFQHVMGPKYNACYKRMVITIPNDWDANFLSYIIMEKGVGGVDAVRSIENLGVSIGRGIEVSGGKTIILNQVAGEVLGGVGNNLTLVLNCLVRRA